MEEDLKAERERGGTLNGVWVPHNTTDAIVDSFNQWKKRTELPAKRLVEWIGISTCKFDDWKQRSGKVNEHNAQVPCDHWLEDWGQQAIVAFHSEHESEGYRRLTYTMMDSDR